MKKGLVLLLVVAMLLSISACGAKDNSSSNADTTAQTKPVNMKLWIFLNPDSTSDPRNVVLKNIVDNYNKNNPNGNTVTVESINYAKFESQSIQAAAAGTGPDIINIYTDMLKQHIAGGTVQPMTSFAEKFIPTMNDYVYSADKLKIDGQIYTLPWESRTFTYWYRSDIYDKAPSSWDDLVKMAASKTTDMASGFTFGLSEGGNGAGFMEPFVSLIQSAGGKLLDDKGKAVFNSDAGVKVLEFMKALNSQKAMNKTALSLTVDDVQSGLQSGTILSCVLGTQRAAAVRKSDLNSKIKSAPIPGIKDGTPSPAIVAGQSLGIGKFAQSPSAAFDFIKTFFTVENQKEWLKANVLTVRKSLYDDPEIKALSNYDEIKSWSDYASNGSVNFCPADYTELSVKLVQAAQNVVFQGGDAKTQLDQVASWYNQKNGLK